MNVYTRNKLLANPHYKLNKKQKDEAERQPMVEFGMVPMHNQEIPMHDVATQPVARTNKSTRIRKA